MNKTKIKNWLIFALYLITSLYVIYGWFNGVPIPGLFEF